MLKKIDTVLTKIEESILLVVFLVMVFVALIQVFNRVLFNSPMAWSDELARYLFIWVVFIGASYATKTDAHVGVTSLTDRLPQGVTRVLSIITNLCCTLFCGVLVYQGVKTMVAQYTFGQVSATLRLPMYFVYLAVVLGGLFMGVRFLLKVGMILTHQEQKPEEPASFT